jgi:hypothetical protein
MMFNKNLMMPLGLLALTVSGLLFQVTTYALHTPLTSLHP